MKKSDPAGTSQTIEITESKAQGDFPYWGYWSALYSSAMNKVDLFDANYQDRQNVSDAFTNLINGPGRIFLADKLWEIGETINLNSGIAMNGLSVPSPPEPILYVPQDSNDNGHLYIGAMCFEDPMQALWGSVANKTTSYAASEATRLQIEPALTRLYEEQIALQSLLQSMPTDSELGSQTATVNTMTNQLARLDNERNQLQLQINQINEELQSLSNLEHESFQLSNQKNTTGSLLNERLSRLSTANTANRAAIHEEAMEIQSEYRNTSNRLHAVEITVSRLRSLNNGDAINGMQELLNVRSLDFQTNAANLTIQQGILSDMETALSNGQEQAITLRVSIEQLTGTIASLQEAYEVTSGYAEESMNLNDNDLIKLFAEHLDRVQSELEELLFMSLRLNADELVASNDADIEARDSLDVADYSDYLSALSDVSDAFTEDEYTLLRHLADFGYSRSYIPGQSRIYALVGMGPTDRRRAFRTLIEEILTLGKSTEKESLLDINSPLYTLKLALKRKDNDLREMSQLIDFLTARKPNINWSE